MPAEKFRTLTDRLARELGLSLVALAREVGVTDQHLTECRSGRRLAKRTLVVALRAVAAGLAPFPEESAAA